MHAQTQNYRNKETKTKIKLLFPPESWGGLGDRYSPFIAWVSPNLKKELKNDKVIYEDENEIKTTWKNG